jgi:Spy/CpxP family protein refolding chaperone
MELATVMQEDKAYSPRVVAAVEKIHHAQSDLEKSTLEHIFAMKSVLTPEQFDKLLKLTGDALTEHSKF